MIVLYAAFSLFLNVIITYGLVFEKGPLPEIGFDGAAWATVIASGIECIILFLHFILLPKQNTSNNQIPKSFNGFKNFGHLVQRSRRSGCPLLGSFDWSINFLLW